MWKGAECYLNPISLLLQLSTVCSDNRNQQGKGLHLKIPSTTKSSRVNTLEGLKAKEPTSVPGTPWTWHLVNGDFSDPWIQLSKFLLLFVWPITLSFKNRITFSISPALANFSSEINVSISKIHFHIPTRTLPRPASKCTANAGSRNLAPQPNLGFWLRQDPVFLECSVNTWGLEFLLKCRRYLSQYTGCQVLWIPSRCFYRLRIAAFTEGLFLLFWNKIVYCEQEVALEMIISILHSENSLYKSTCTAPGFDQEAEFLLSLRDTQLLAKHRGLPFM